MKFLFRTDVHLADKSPASWKADYQSEIWSNLEQVRDIARREGVVAVLDGGDFFHMKSPLRNSLGLITRAIRLHRDEYPCPTWCVEGNHDITHNNLESIIRQPLGVLYASGAFQHLRNEVFTAPGLQVRVVGVPYSPHLTLGELRGIVKQEGDTHLIVVAHTLASNDPPEKVQDFWNEPVFAYKDLVAGNGPDAFLFGHWHRDQGIQQIGDVYFVNQGALSRGALVRENLDRVPKVALLECVVGGELKVTSIPLSVPPASEVFDLERKESAEKERDDIDQFVLRVVSESTFDPSESIEDNIRKLEFADDVRAEALRFLEMVD